MKRIVNTILIYLFCLTQFAAMAQGPKKLNSAEILESIKKMQVLGSVLYVAAHPDDENTNLISYLSNERHFDTRYISLTRGDGGQNLIGTESAELLGVMRTQELLRARGIDGGKQSFSRANDFGYSKNPDETLKIWEKQEVLSDLVWAIRQYQPDVIINRFDHSTARPNHGHHTASAILSNEAYSLSANKDAFPEQLKYVKPWQANRQFMNVSWWWFGGKDKFEKLDKSKWLSTDIGVFYPSKGKSNLEIAAESRSQHRCQGMGTMPERGEYKEYFEQLQGEKVSNDIFEGINTTWTRIEGGAWIAVLLKEVEKDFNYNNPSASVSKLLDAYKLIEVLPDSYWKRTKMEDMKEVIKACMGLYLEASSSDYSATPGALVNVTIEATNRSKVEATLKAVSFVSTEKDTIPNLHLEYNKANKFKTVIGVPNNMTYSGPYWVGQSHPVGMYKVDNQELRGLAETPRPLQVKFSILLGDRLVDFVTPLVNRYEDNAKGEMYRPFEVMPEVFVSLSEKAYIFPDNSSKVVKVVVRAGAENVKGTVSLTQITGFNFAPSNFDFNFKIKGEEKTFQFMVTPNGVEAAGILTAMANVNGKTYTKALTSIAYDHIPTQMVLRDASAKIVKVDLRREKRNIGYIMGAGDEIPNYLTQIGYDVSILKEEDFDNLKKYDVVIAGIRVYNTIERMKFYQAKIMDFVSSGGTYIVQYNTNSELYVDNFAPYPMKISRDRVTLEDAEMRLLKPENLVLTTPNRISSKDFEGWVQERGLYFANEWDPKLEPILSCNDPTETAKDGGLLVGKYGNGYFVYTGLALWRQLPAGVSGAYRLFSNMISLQGKKAEAETPKKGKKGQ